MKIGLIGKGSIGTFLLNKINREKLLPGYKITVLFDDREKSKEDLLCLAREYHCDATYDIESFLQQDIDLVIECATIDVAKAYSYKVVKQKDLLLISIGAFADDAFRHEMEKITLSTGNKVYLPSGAIGGLDVIKAAKLAGELDTVTLTTRKPAYTLTTESLLNEKVVFEGSARDAIEEFPKNANVAITLSLAGIGVNETKVKIIADPTISKNIHQITASGGFGDFELLINNNPSPDNPKTSYLTSLSILSSIANIENTVVVGS